MNDASRRNFLLLSGAAGLGFLTGDLTKVMANTQQEPFPELVEATIAELRTKLQRGTLTSRRLTEMYLERIRVIDPKLRSVIEINPDALAIADDLDRERRRGRTRGPLHGIPILIKDNIDTADRMLTTAGSLAMLDAPRPARDAFVVTRLRKAGVVILGKTNLSEWANFRGNRSISGWSGRGGQTNSPYFLDQNPCGSSSGSGVAVSANLAAATVGTETNGSIICPAVTNGVVGLKPTVGLISRSGIIPIAHTQDTAGPMTRTVADAAALLTAMTGADNEDPITKDGARRAAKDYTKFLDKDGLKGARLGVVMYPPRQNADRYRSFFQPFLDRIAAAGATLVEVAFPDFSATQADRLAVLQYEFKAGLNKYLAGRGGKYRSLEDLIRFNEANKEKELTLFGQELFVESQKKADLNDKGYLDALARIRRSTREDGIDGLKAKHNLDGFVGPTAGQAWAIAAVAGYPSVTVPVGIRDNAPAGMFFFGPAWSEPSVIKFAYAFEQLTRGRTVPKLEPKRPA